MISPWLILPFGLLLALIAVGPVIAHSWWEKHYPKVAFVLAGITFAYYFWILKDRERILETAHEYISFICLIGSLFVVSGGIHIRVKGESTPWKNTLLLGVGALLANIVGTTGASMLLIRPYLRSNKYRLTAYHVVFFIFIVSNVGGSLTPIGDPPLYLGYLRGIPFVWTMGALFPMWLIGVLFLLTIFYIMDRRNFLRAPRDIREKETAHENWRFDGLHNLIWLALILVSLWIEKPMFLREFLMLASVGMSWLCTKKPVYIANDFSWKPILEVIVLFAGIFVTMMPALDWLENNAHLLGISSLSSFYWGSGILTSVLDNAPTYLNFLSAAQGMFVNASTIQEIQQLLSHGQIWSLTGNEAQHAGEMVRTIGVIKQFHPEISQNLNHSNELLKICYLIANYGKYIVAMSIGSVFFGACTYIGNGPNFMVKSIAQHSGVKMPSFFGFIFRFTIPILFPLLILIWILFFRT
jgi:Na+/H+ antiporter NhaD/arsenite permease-like protein